MTVYVRLKMALSGLVIALVAGSAAAQDYPGSRPIRVIVPYGPGASTNLLARATADITAKKYGYTFVIKSLPARARCSAHARSRTPIPTATPSCFRPPISSTICTR